MKKLTWEEDTEPYALARDDRIRNVAKVIVFIGRTRPTVVVGTREVSLNRFFKILKRRRFKVVVIKFCLLAAATVANVINNLLS